MNDTPASERGRSLAQIRWAKRREQQAAHLRNMVLRDHENHLSRKESTMKNSSPTQGIKTSLMLVTPDLAARWLHPDVNNQNRPIRDSHVANLAREITEGRWVVTHQGIAFDINDKLNDGQHRLSAIVRSGIAVHMMVTSGLSIKAFAATDGGLKRTTADRIHLVDNQVQNKLICLAVKQYLDAIDRSHPHNSVGEIEDEFLKNTDQWLWVSQELLGVDKKLRKGGVLASLGTYRIANPNAAASFVAGYRSGADLMEGSPVLRLRNDAMLADNLDRCTYWRSQTLMKAHMDGRMITYVPEAAEDMLGNKNVRSVIQERTKRGLKSAETRRAREGWKPIGPRK